MPCSVLVKHHLCPGDNLVLTAALECLHAQHPGKFVTGVESSCPAIFENNPHVQKFDRYDRELFAQYPLIHQADHRPAHFMQGFTEHLGRELGVGITCDRKKPCLYLTEEEKGWMSQVEEVEGYRGKFWLINAGHKNDYTIKKWRRDCWQEVVNRLLGRVQFVQVGADIHNHPPLKNVINLVGKTDLRQLIRLGWHAQGALTPESFLHHLMAAYSKPCVTLASGFLPLNWVRYHTGTVLTHAEKMPCCVEGKGCWRAKVVRMDARDDSLCLLPVLGEDPVAKCMQMITPDEVVNAVLAYYHSGRLNF